MLLFCSGCFLLDLRNPCLPFIKVILELIRDIPTADTDALVGDIMGLAAEAPYPIAAIGKDGQLKGIVTKAKVLSSLT